MFDASTHVASVVVRTKDSAKTLERVLESLRAQTVRSEIVIVDSGSTDTTLDIAASYADHVIAIPAERFSFGYSLNVGARTATAPIHFALSSHSVPPNSTWIERSLAKYDHPLVAATTGAPTLPGSRAALCGTHYQTLDDALAFPWWGMSNTGSSWRADVWERLEFDERLQACEDKEWGLRVLAEGWRIAVDASLSVSDRHRYSEGIPTLYRRAFREFAAIGTFADLPASRTRDVAREWFTDVPIDAPLKGWRRRLNYFRVVELIGRHRGINCARRTRNAGPNERMYSSDQAPASRTGLERL